MTLRSIPVCIVGAGPVGLSMALALARQNIHSIVLERHSTTTQHPKTRSVSARTMELFHLWGNAEKLLKYTRPQKIRQTITAQLSTGKKIAHIEMGELSYPTLTSSFVFVSQDLVEASLYRTLLDYKECNVEFLKEMISFEQDSTGVTVHYLDRKSGEKHWIRAQYLIAADGAHSQIRQQLGIPMDGPNDLAQFCSVYCEFDLYSPQYSKKLQNLIQLLDGPLPTIGFFPTAPEQASRSFLSVDGVNRWIVSMRFTRKNKPEDFTDEYCVQEIRRLVDIPTFPVSIINKSFWKQAAQVARKYRKGRVFLVGDAAHRMPPPGGLGMNTGIHDAHNLAWKLAFVLRFGISDKLLNTYYDERAPVAKRNVKWCYENAKRYIEFSKIVQSKNFEKLKNKLYEQHKTIHCEGLDLGFIYHSTAVISESDQVLSKSADHYVPIALPGIRAPHLKLMKGKKTFSTLELFEKSFVLLVGEKGQAWQRAAYDGASTWPLSLKIYRVSSTITLDKTPPAEKHRLRTYESLIDPQDRWHKCYEIAPTGAILIRPDGHVAWRSKSMSSNPKETLEWVIRSILPSLFYPRFTKKRKGFALKQSPQRKARDFARMHGVFQSCLPFDRT